MSAVVHLMADGHQSRELSESVVRKQRQLQLVQGDCKQHQWRIDHELSMGRDASKLLDKHDELIEKRIDCKRRLSR